MFPAATKTHLECNITSTQSHGWVSRRVKSGLKETYISQVVSLKIVGVGIRLNFNFYPWVGNIEAEIARLQPSVVRCEKLEHTWNC